MENEKIDKMITEEFNNFNDLLDKKREINQRIKESEKRLRDLNKKRKGN